MATEKSSPKTVEIRDVIHGSVELYQWELDIIDSPVYQRLRNIKQLGFAEFAYPGATHNRYTHSIGAMHLAGIAFQSIFKDHYFSSTEVFYRFYYLTRICALLHDVGHGPFSHAIEFAMPGVDKLELPTEVVGKDKKRQANHEDYTLKIILDSSLTPVIERGYNSFDIKPWHIAAIMNLQLKEKDDLFIDNGVNFRKIIHQVISSEIDADRMDYLQRDSYYTGVSYGKFDANWLISNLTCHFTGTTAHLALSDRAIYTFEDFLLSRYHMFLMVYLHHKSVIFEEMLKKYLSTTENPYPVPADIEKYILCDDASLYNHVRKDNKNYWAKLINARKTFKVALEVHAGLNSRKDPLSDPRVKDLEERLTQEKVPFIKTSSGKALSSYIKPYLDSDADVDENTIFVQFNDRMNPSSYIPLEKFTDLFRRYGEMKNIVRIYVPDPSLKL